MSSEKRRVKAVIDGGMLQQMQARVAGGNLRVLEAPDSDQRPVAEAREGGALRADGRPERRMIWRGFVHHGVPIRLFESQTKRRTPQVSSWRETMLTAAMRHFVAA
jgi:hypothetical protein